MKGRYNMKGWIYKGAEGFEFHDDLPYPVCGENDAIIKCRVSAVCGSENHAWPHDAAFMNVHHDKQMGHETVAEIVELGENVKELELGQRVFPLPYLCRPRSEGTVGCSLGAFSEYILVKNAEKDVNLWPIPDNVTDEEAAGIEGITVGYHAAKMSGAGEGKNVLIFGAAGIGVAAAQAAKYMGAAKVMVVGRREERLALAKEMDLECVSTFDPDWKHKVYSYFGSYPLGKGTAANVQCFVDAAGSSELFEDIIGLMGYGTTLSVPAMYRNAPSVPLLTVTFYSKHIVGSAGQDADDVRNVIQMAASKKYHFDKYLTKLYAPEELVTAVKDAMAGKILKAGLDFRK